MDKQQTLKEYFFNVGTRLDRGKIIPVFLPFAGCPFKCLYCAQDNQTGVGEVTVLNALKSLEEHIQKHTKNTIIPQDLNIDNTNKSIDTTVKRYQVEATKDTPNREKPSKAIEIAFYGGTFTALCEQDFDACLLAFITHKKNIQKLGFTVYGRCSTRPDCLANTQRLTRMKEAGIDLIELGIQSFNNNVLYALGRAYDTNCAKQACSHLKQLGFYLGIQLMPSSPCKGKTCQDITTFYDDVNTALSFSPSCIRYYPCLVLENTPLASLWKGDSFKPWNIETTVEALGYALFLAWEKEVPIIRLSVAFEENFEKNILAGARHPALGSLIQARALRYAFKCAQEKCRQNIFISQNNPLTKRAILTQDAHHTYTLYVPKSFQGFIFGHKNTLKKEWQEDKMLENILFI